VKFTVGKARAVAKGASLRPEGMPASASASANARSPWSRRISHWCSNRVFARSVYRFTLRRVRHLKLPGHEVQHLARHIERILQERPEPPHGHQLEREPGPHVLYAMPAGVLVRAAPLW
jgi:hypothetical protein